MIQTLLLLGLLGLPVVGGLALIAVDARAPIRRKANVRWALLLTAGAVALCALALRLIGGDVAVQLTWLPGAGPMTLSLGASSLLAAVATATALALTVWIAAPPSGGAGGAMLLALAAGNVAFLAGHFLLRYVALEVVGLLIAAAPLIEARHRPEGPSAAAHAAWVYLVLRLGDAGMLVAILTLWSQTGTLAIDAALAGGAALTGMPRLWVVGGFLLAVAVKIGLWPFFAWIRSGEALGSLAGGWLYATLMPNLGLYLLYRVAPLVVEVPGLRWGWIAAGVVAGGAALVSAQGRPIRSWRPARVMAIAGAAAWCLALGVHYRIAWWGLMVLSLVRLPLFLRRGAVLAWSSWEILDDGIQHVAQRLHDDVQVGLLERGVGSLATGLGSLAGWLHDHVEEDALERGLTEGADQTLYAARRLYDKVEQEGLESWLRGLVHATLHASHHLRVWHGGRLRINLAWVAASLIVAVLVALVV